MRKTQVGTGDRSAKIRTYNYPQSRVTDHRIGWTTHDLQGFMDGDIGPLIEALKLADVEEQLGEGGRMTTERLGGVVRSISCSRSSLDASTRGASPNHFSRRVRSSPRCTTRRASGR